MKRHLKMILIFVSVMLVTGCDKGLLSSARDIEGLWKGTLVSSDNNVNQSHTVTSTMSLNIAQTDNKIIGIMMVGSNRGEFEGTISGVKIDFRCVIGNGCINVHGTFTSTNMEGMKNSTPPPYLTCDNVLNDGWGSKGIEWHLVKQ
jgi:hypothetical protein